MDRTHAAASGEDRLSALPDDVLLLILRDLPSTADAAQTSVLSSRWRHLWTFLSRLIFSLPAGEVQKINSALEVHQGNHLNLAVMISDATPESVEAWLPQAAPRISRLLLAITPELTGNPEDGDDEDDEEDAAFELPCLENATIMVLFLEYLGMALPPVGVFSRLVKLALNRVQLYGPVELGDLVSSQRCPSLRRLILCRVDLLAMESDHVAIKSHSLRFVALRFFDGFQQITMVAPELEELQVSNCFVYTPPAINVVSSPKLESLLWKDAYDPTTVRIGDSRRLGKLTTDVYYVYGHEDDQSHNEENLIRLLRRFSDVQTLVITLMYPVDISNLQYLMEDMTKLPRTTSLELTVLSTGHAFGASSFHVLRLCNGIRKLSLLLLFSDQVQFVCPPDCICDHLADWKTAELKLDFLQDVELTNLSGAECELTFVKQLFSWATVLRKVKITIAYKVSESRVSELRQTLLSFSRPEICVEFQVQNSPREDPPHLRDC